jgi:serine/threonine protein kinase
MAEVFKAKAFGVEGFEKIIAIKKILPSMAEDADFIQMFIDEAKIAGQLNHANICQIFELGRIDDSHFIAMEYIWGKDLLQIQNRFRRLKRYMPLPMAGFIAGKMCEGLDYAHRKKDATGKPLNIIHRDVSPQNVIVSYEGEVKVIDFGIAKAASRSSKTQAGVFKGKFGYMSPEQVGGKPLDQRADIFAIGTILYELLTNDRLFLGESDFATLEKVRNVAVPPPSTVNKEIPPELDRIIMKALAKDLGERYQWASELHDDLLDFVSQFEPVYNAKALAGWMRESFAPEMKKEAAVLDQQRKIGREAMNSAVPQKLAMPPSARLKGTLAPTSNAPVAPQSPSTSTEAAEPVSEAEPIDASLARELEQVDAPAEGDILNEKTTIQQPDEPASGDLPNQATQIFDGQGGGGHGSDEGDLKGQATAIFNPDEQKQKQAPAPAPMPAPPPPDPYASAMNPAMQNPSMVGPMQFAAGYQSGVMSAMPMQFQSGVMGMGQPGHTGMMMLPNGAIVPAMMPQAAQQAAEPVRPNALWKDILVGVVVAIAVVGLVLGVRFALTPGKGTVVLTVQPQRPANVYLDGKEFGRIDPGSAFVLRDLVRGPHQLLVRAEDGEAQQTVEVAAGEVMPITVQLQVNGGGGSTSAAGGGQGSGVIRLRLPPDGALVSINGRLIAEKDIQRGFLVPAGVAQEVSVKKAGKRPETFTVTLQPGQEYDRAIELKDGRGKLVVSTRPPGADVTVNGRIYGKTPVTIEDLDPTKAAKVVIKKRGFATINRQVSFLDTFEQTVDVDLGGGGGGGKDDDKGGGGTTATGGGGTTSSGGGGTGGTGGSGGGGGGGEGFLIANSQPFARVFVDDKDTGKTTPIAPRDRIPLSPGKHKVTFVASGKKYTYDVTIRPGEEFRLIRNLNE